MPFPVWRNRFRIFFFFSGEMEEIKKSIWIPIESTRVGFNLIIFFFSKMAVSAIPEFRLQPFRRRWWNRYNRVEMQMIVVLNK